MKISSNILEKTEKHVVEIFEQCPKELSYHNLAHTRNVVESAKKIGLHYNLTPAELELLLISAWFHDVGYLKTMHQHEQSSVEIAVLFLEKYNFSKKKIAQISTYILSTKPKTTPKSKLGRMLADADLFDLGTANHFDNAKLLKQELNAISEFYTDDLNWIKIEIDFLNEHRYYTDFAKKTLDPIKQRHLLQRKKELEVLINKTSF